MSLRLVAFSIVTLCLVSAVPTLSFAQESLSSEIEIVEPGDLLSFTDRAEIDLVFDVLACNGRYDFEREQFVSWRVFDRQGEEVCSGLQVTPHVAPRECQEFFVEDVLCSLAPGRYRLDAFVGPHWHFAPDDSDRVRFGVIPSLMKQRALLR